MSQLEPQLYNFEKEGLWLGWCKTKALEKNAIDESLKRILGKDWNKPYKPGQKITWSKR